MSFIFEIHTVGIKMFCWKKGLKRQTKIKNAEYGAIFSLHEILLRRIYTLKLVAALLSTQYALYVCPTQFETRNSPFDFSKLIDMFYKEVNNHWMLSSMEIYLLLEKRKTNFVVFLENETYIYVVCNHNSWTNIIWKQCKWNTKNKS